MPSGEGMKHNFIIEESMLDGTGRVVCSCGWSMGYSIEHTPRALAVEAARQEHDRQKEAKP